jgi:hypothetical protein
VQPWKAKSLISATFSGITKSLTSTSFK